MKNSVNTPATTSNASTVKKATVKKAKANQNAAVAEDNSKVVEMPETKKVAKQIVRQTADEKVAALKNSIMSHFGITEEKLTAYTISRLAKSSRKTNLIDFHTTLIVELVTKDGLLAKLL